MATSNDGLLEDVTSTSSRKPLFKLQRKKKSFPRTKCGSQFHTVVVEPRWVNKSQINQNIYMFVQGYCLIGLQSQYLEVQVMHDSSVMG